MQKLFAKRYRMCSRLRMESLGVGKVERIEIKRKLRGPRLEFITQRKKHPEPSKRLFRSPFQRRVFYLLFAPKERGQGHSSVQRQSSDFTFELREEHDADAGVVVPAAAAEHAARDSHGHSDAT
jgi:hypothetical protein